MSSKSIVNGAVPITTREVGTSVIIGTCNSGFASYGDTKVTCKASGSWHSEYTCRKHFFVLMMLKYFSRFFFSTDSFVEGCF